MKALMLLLLTTTCLSVAKVTIKGIPSANNYILYEESSIGISRQSQLSITSNVPLTIQRYGDGLISCTSLVNDGIILVTSTCDTSDTSIVPVVKGGDDGETTVNVNVELQGVNNEQQMDFMDSASYRAIWEENNDGIFDAEQLRDLGFDVTTSSAASISKPLMMIRSLLQKVVKAAPRQARALKDTCTYNVEVLLSGCLTAWDPLQIVVNAPKTRVIDSVTNIVNKEVVEAWQGGKKEDGTPWYGAEFKYIATMDFPTEDAYDIQANEMPSGCMMVCGRPFVDSSGNSLLASSISANECGAISSTWLGRESAIETQTSSATNNTNKMLALGQKWTRSALEEHASIASFATFSIALMTNGAPSDLVEDSLKAGLDEIRHARASFDIASKLLGKEVVPGPLPPSSHGFEYDMKALALAAAKEGCIGETLSAMELAAEVELLDAILAGKVVRSSKYTGIGDIEVLTWIRNELHIIATEESSHADLAWRTIKWVCSINNEACNVVKEEVLNEDKLIRAFHHHYTPKLLERLVGM